MLNAILMSAGGLLWLCLHRYGGLYMGEATLTLLAVGLLGYWLRKNYEHHRHQAPNLYGYSVVKWTPWHILWWLSGGIVLEGITRLMV